MNTPSLSDVYEPDKNKSSFGSAFIGLFFILLAIALIPLFLGESSITLGIYGLILGVFMLLLIRWLIEEAHTGLILAFIIVVPLTGSFVIDFLFGSLIINVPPSVYQTIIRTFALFNGLSVGIAILYILTNRVRLLDTTLDSLFMAWLIWGVISLFIGFINGFNSIYVLSDFYKWLIIPLVYYSVKSLATFKESDVFRVFYIYIILGAIKTASIGIFILYRLFFSGQLTVFGTGGADFLFTIYVAYRVMDKSKKSSARVLYALLLVLIFFISVLSLKRSSWFLVPTAIILSWLIDPEIPISKTIALLMILILLTLAAYSLLPTAITQQVTNRWLYTFSFSTTDRTYDPSTELRFEEAESALTEMKIDASFINYIIGMGVGAEYYAPYHGRPGSKPGYAHQIHITYIDILFRQGLIGILFYLSLIAILTWAYIKLRKLWISNIFNNKISVNDFLVTKIIFAAFIVQTIKNISGLGFIGDFSWGILLGLFGAVLVRHYATSRDSH